METLFRHFRAAAAEVPEKTFATFMTLLESAPPVTYAEQVERVLGTMTWLREQSIKAGDRVAYMADTSPQHIDLWFAVTELGGIYVPLNTALRGLVLEHQLRLTGPVLVICSPDYADLVVEALGTDAAAAVVPVGSIDRSRIDPADRDGSRTSFVREYDPATIMFTSGTTGPSKGVTWSHRSQLYLAETTVDSMGYTSDEVVFTCLPLFHGNALLESVLSAALSRGRVVVANRFSASRYWEQIRTSGATTTNMLSAMVPILLAAPPSATEREHELRHALVIPAPPEAEAALRERTGINVIEAYGLADAGMCLWAPAQGRPDRSCGIPVDGWECAIFDSEDHPVPDGEAGELVVRPTKPWIASLGYWDNPSETVRTWRNQWIHTGDLFRKDAHGWFYFMDRAAESIRRKGENISSFEVEQALLRHPDVAECAVYAVPSDLSEHEVMAAVLPREGAELDVRDLIDVASRNLPKFAVPRYVRIVDDFPRTETQKVRKPALKADGVTGSTIDMLALLPS